MKKICTDLHRQLSEKAFVAYSESTFVFYYDSCSGGYYVSINRGETPFFVGTSIDDVEEFILSTEMEISI